MSELYCCGYLVVMIITATRHCMVILQYNIVLPKGDKNKLLVLNLFSFLARHTV